MLANSDMFQYSRMKSETVLQSTRRLSLRSMTDLTAKLVSLTEALLSVALYTGAVVLTICAAGEVPDAGTLTLQQAITSELLLVTPVYLSSRRLHWLRLPCSLYLGCVTGAFLAVAGVRSIWSVGLFLSRFLLLFVTRRRTVQFAVLTGISAVLKHLA